MAANRRRRLAGRAGVPALAAGFALALVGGALPPAAAADPPRRIVSLSVCVDEILVRIADRRRIAGLTVQAANPGYATISERIGGIALNNGRAEDVARLDPDLVIGDSFNARSTIHLLRRMKMRVAIIPYAATAGRIRRNIRMLAKLIGREAQGAALIGRFDRALAAARTAAGARRYGALLYQARGFVPGKGTLADAALRDAGFINAALRIGAVGVKQISLEQLVTAAPKVVIFLRSVRNAPSIARESFGHPAFRRMTAQAALAAIPGNLLICGGPAYADAVTRLSRIRRRLTDDR